MSVPMNETQTDSTPVGETPGVATPPQEAPVTAPEVQSVPEAAPAPTEAPTPSDAPTPGAETRTYSEEDVQPLPTEASDGEPLEADEVPDDIKRLLEEPNGPFQLASGDIVVIRQLKFREFLRLLRIVTRGASSNMAGMQVNFGDTDSFVQTFFALTLFAIPEADEEVIDFIQGMVDPAELTGNKSVDEAKRQRLYVELSNPEMEDVVNIIAKVIAAEGADLQALGKRLMNMWTLASRVGKTQGIQTTGRAS